MRKILKPFALAALLASEPAGAQVVLNASSSAPPGHPLTAAMLVPFCADISKVTAGRVRCNILSRAPFFFAPRARLPMTNTSSGS